jgi:hypothetical protein
MKLSWMAPINDAITISDQLLYIDAIEEHFLGNISAYVDRPISAELPNIGPDDLTNRTTAPLHRSATWRLPHEASL